MVLCGSALLSAVFRNVRAACRNLRMRKEGEGGCICLPTIRSLALFAVGIVTVFILYTVIRDQDTVRQCHSMLGSGDSRHTQVSANASKWDYNWDRKQYRNPQEAKAAVVRTILLVRHGNYDLNTGKLTPLGERQADMTGRRLKELNMDYKIIYHSTMERAAQTAKIMQKHLPHLSLVADDDIEEGGPVPPDPTVSYWQLPGRTYFTDGPRLEAAFRKYFYRADPSQKVRSFEILVGHANIFKFFTLRALQFPRDAWMRVFIAHASITLLHVNPDGTVTLTRLGDSGHFPPDHVSY